MNGPVPAAQQQVAAVPARGGLAAAVAGSTPQNQQQQEEHGYHHHLHHSSMGATGVGANGDYDEQGVFSPAAGAAAEGTPEWALLDACRSPRDWV